MKCAILTSLENKNLLAEEKPLRYLFANKSIEALPVVWNEENNWQQYDFAIIRSTWDYYEKFSQYMNTLQKIEDSGCVLLNSLKTVKWNIDKIYLLELQRQNTPVFPTFLIENIQNTDLDSFFALWQTDELIIKPTISAGAYHTYRINKQNLVEITNKIASLKLSFLLQPFATDVLCEGEYSFIFFGNEYSHTVLKYPTKGDFRVQQEYGGRTILVSPSSSDLTSAKAVVNGLKHQSLYSRVDMVRYNGKLCLMELEQIEPQLFFGYRPISLKIFVDHVADYIHNLLGND